MIAAVIWTFIEIEIERKEFGSVMYGNHITFVFYAVVISLPILLFGVGYPNLLIRAYRRVKRK